MKISLRLEWFTVSLRHKMNSILFLEEGRVPCPIYVYMYRVVLLSYCHVNLTEYTLPDKREVSWSKGTTRKTRYRMNFGHCFFCVVLPNGRLSKTPLLENGETKDQSPG